MMRSSLMMAAMMAAAVAAVAFFGCSSSGPGDGGVPADGASGDGSVQDSGGVQDGGGGTDAADDAGAPDGSGGDIVDDTGVADAGDDAGTQDAGFDAGFDGGAKGILGTACGDDNECGTDEGCVMGFCIKSCRDGGVEIPNACTIFDPTGPFGNAGFRCPANVPVCLPGDNGAVPGPCLTEKDCIFPSVTNPADYSCIELDGILPPNMVGGLCMHKRTGDVTVRDNPRDCDSSKDPWETGCASGMCIGNVCSALCDRSSVCGSGDFCQYNPFKKDANSALNKTDFPQDYLGNYYYIVRSGLCLGRAGSLSDCMAAGTTGCSAGEYCYPGRDVTLDGGYSWNCVAGPGADGGTVKQVGESCASHSACRAGSCAFKNYCSSPCSLTRAGDCSFDGGTNMGCFAMPASNNPAQLVLLENDAGVSYPLANYSNNVCMKKGPGAPCFVQASPNCLGGPCIADGGSEGLCGPADGGI